VKVEQEQEQDHHHHEIPEPDSDEIQQMLNDFLDQLHDGEREQEDEREQEQPEDLPEEDEREQQDEDEPDEQPDDESDDDEPEQERKSLPLTKGQDERFDNLFERISKKAKETFGSTMESETDSPRMPGGVFDGEAVAKFVEIESRGVTYRVILTAARYEDE